MEVPIFLKSGSLNLLQSSGPVQACNGIALPLLIEDAELIRMQQNGPRRDSIGLKVKGTSHRSRKQLLADSKNCHLIIVTC